MNKQPLIGLNYRFPENVFVILKNFEYTDLIKVNIFTIK